ncbi:hypothetical protein N5K27_16555 [Pigmentiphaga sp. GD03639]|uniref:Lipoprotein n=1 Tax=Pigmentiphaga kullae TaxID=151784 RepID=A0A4Q7NE69_9BURK|nr:MULTISPECIES: hypothetical protein [Pigmentiphaga]MDH2237909.1 hypothetical protein [Pigmentiphaga sp. GD03639]RZS81408.1 hypothetical protein EV675_4031 [Pigmentiphaga kullae]
MLNGKMLILVAALAGGASPAYAAPTVLASADGWTFVNGEWVRQDHAYAMKDGRLVHTDTLPHASKETRPATPRAQSVPSARSDRFIASDGWVFENGEWSLPPRVWGK